MTSALDVLRAAIAGRRVVVLGSAPLDAPLELAGDDVAIPVNGGVSSVPAGRLVDVWVLNSRSDVHTWGGPRRRLGNAMLAQGANRDVAIAVLLTRDDDSEAATLKALQLHRTRLRQAVTLSRPERTDLEKRSGARQPAHTKQALSLGLFTVGMCLELGAAHVRLAGFSWQAGYAYLPNDRAVTDRGHVHADQIALAHLVARHGERIEHALEIPARIMTKAQKEIEAMPRNTTRVQAGSSTEPVKARKVRATEMTFYGGARRREGEVFVLRSPSHFKAKCMEDVPDDTPVGPAPAEGLKPAGTRIPSLKPNAADPVDDGAGDNKGDDAVL